MGLVHPGRLRQRDIPYRLGCVSQAFLGGVRPRRRRSANVPGSTSPPIDLPMGSTPGKYVRANASLITTTRSVSIRSSTLIVRPPRRVKPRLEPNWLFILVCFRPRAHRRRQVTLPRSRLRSVASQTRVRIPSSGTSRNAQLVSLLETPMRQPPTMVDETACVRMDRVRVPKILTKPFPEILTTSR